MRNERLPMICTTLATIPTAVVHLIGEYDISIHLWLLACQGLGIPVDDLELWMNDLWGPKVERCVSYASKLYFFDTRDHTYKPQSEFGSFVCHCLAKQGISIQLTNRIPTFITTQAVYTGRLHNMGPPEIFRLRIALSASSGLPLDLCQVYDDRSYDGWTSIQYREILDDLDKDSRFAEYDQQPFAIIIPRDVQKSLICITRDLGIGRGPNPSIKCPACLGYHLLHERYPCPIWVQVTFQFVYPKKWTECMLHVGKTMSDGMDNIGRSIARCFTRSPSSRATLNGIVYM